MSTAVRGNLYSVYRSSTITSPGPRAWMMSRMARWMALSLASSAWLGAVEMTPASTTATPPGAASSTPNPVATRPGSTPMIRRRSREPGRDRLLAGSRSSESPAPPGSAPSGGFAPAPTGGCPMGGRIPSSMSRRGDGVDDLVGDVVVGVDGLDVVLLLEGLDQPQHCCGVLALHAHGGLGHHVDLGLEDRHAGALETLANRLHFISSRR